MRLFQNSGVYAGYLPRLARLSRDCGTFAERRDAFLADRYSACHVLQPVLLMDTDSFFTNGDDEILQRMWGREHGMPGGVSLESILLAQIEQHRSEVLYNLDPVRYGSAFVSRLPGCVKAKVAWRAVPAGDADFFAYNRVVCNFPGILLGYEAAGTKTAYFSPAYDPVMDRYAANADRQVDVLFVGGFSRHHRRRAEVLEAVASLGAQANVIYHLDRSRLTRLAESPVGRLLPLGRHRRPQAICALSADAVFGLDLYTALSHAKIVLNGAIDASGVDRGNMRCWEAMGCGALMLSDEGIYPAGMLPGRDFVTYRDGAEAVAKISQILSNSNVCRTIAAQGHSSIAESYSKAKQWEAFVRVVEEI